MHFCLIQLNNKQWWFAAGSMLWKMVHTEDMKMQSRWEALCGPWTSSAGRTNMWAFKSRQQRFNFPKPHSYQNLNKDLSKSQISMCSPQISLGSHPQSFHVWCGKCSCFWMGELDKGPQMQLTPSSFPGLWYQDPWADSTSWDSFSLILTKRSIICRKFTILQTDPSLNHHPTRADKFRFSSDEC
jgi:hypothetical protein